MKASMNRTLKTISIVLFFVIGCKKDDNPVSTVSQEPAFIVDAINVSSEVKTDTSTGVLATYFPLKLVGHFVGRPGSINGFSFSADKLAQALFLEPFAPTPIDVPVLFYQEFRNLNSFPGRDSLFVLFSFGGSFWEKKDGTISNYGSFSFRDSLWVRIKR